MNSGTKFRDKKVISNSGTKIIIIKRAQNCHLLCKGPESYHSASKTHMTDGIFKLSSIPASVTYQIPCISWNHWIQWKFCSILEKLHRPLVFMHSLVQNSSFVSHRKFSWMICTEFRKFKCKFGQKWEKRWDLNSWRLIASPVACH